MAQQAAGIAVLPTPSMSTLPPAAPGGLSSSMIASAVFSLNSSARQVSFFFICPKLHAEKHEIKRQYVATAASFALCSGPSGVVEVKPCASLVSHRKGHRG